jgi:peptide/nickel transport system permease protein
MRRLAIVVGALGVLAVGLPFAAPNRASEQFADRAYAPPTRIHLRDAGGWHAPFIYRQTLEDRLMRRYADDRGVRVPLQWLQRGRLVTVDATGGPLLVLGADSLGRDIFSRVLAGARLSLGVALLGVLGALAIGTAIGGLAGAAGGRVDAILMLVADAVLVLPGAYAVLVLRGVLPIVLGTTQVFVIMAGLFAVSAWPHVSRGVRAIVATERAREYAEAARAAGAGPFRLLWHLLPAARGFLGVEVVLLVPALLVAEATVSVLGLGFPEPDASWGTMLQESANVTALQSAPWLLAPAAALFLVVLAINAGARGERALTTGR